VNLVERAPRQRGLRRFLACLAVASSAVPTVAAAEPIASSSFAGVENPLTENGAWEPMFSMAPDHTVFQKANGAFIDRFDGNHNNHAAARTTAAVPTDHYSEIVVGHIGNEFSYVGATVRVQTSGPAVDSLYLYWGSLANGQNNFLYRIAANGTSYSAASLVPHSPLADGDRIRLVARGPLLYGIKNGVREFIYNTGQDGVRYEAGTTGMLAYVPGPPVTNATITSWSTGAVPASTATWASSNFAGVEDPLDEGDRWFPLPGYAGFRKAGGLAIGKNGGHNLSGVWSISPPAKQYSEVTLGAAGTGGGGPMVRIDRNSLDQSGWLLFLWADNPSRSGIYRIGKVNPDDGGFTLVRSFTPEALLTGDKWRLTADGNVLEVFRNGVSQFTFTTDGTYPTGDVGMEALTPAFTLMGWEGGATTGPALAPAIASFAPASGPVGTAVTITGTNFTGATAVAFNGVSATFTTSSATTIQAVVPAGATTGPISVTTPGGTATSGSAFTVIPAPVITGFAPASGPSGSSVTINGTGLSGATAVAFNGTSATFTVPSDSAIQATVPAGATTGTLSVTTPGGTATSGGAFTVLSPPAIAGFAPAAGPAGTSVTINGGNFTGATAVAFNGVSASFTVSSDTAIQTAVPAGATTGPISVTTAGGTTASTGAFAIVGPPAIAGLSPASGAVGTSVTIGGSSLSGASAVTFNGLSATFTVTSDTAIRAIVPAGATTGPVSVTTDAGTATSASNFTVTVSLSVAKAGNGQGTVASTSNLPPIGATYEVGTVVTLTATPATGSDFTSWTGCDSVSGSTCTVTLSSSRSVAAVFTLKKFPLTVTKTKLLTGSGTVTATSNPSSPSQINCGPNCTVSYDYGTTVTLTATPDLLSLFNGWSGCDSASGTTCTVSITAARSVTASFLP